MNENYNVQRNKLMHSNGTTAYETISVIVPSFLYCYFTVLLISFCSIYLTKTRQFLLEFTVLVLPIVLNITLLADYTVKIIATWSIICLSSSFLLTKYFYTTDKNNKIKSCELNNYVTNARSTINIMSVIAILAVDFNIFPRRFAKTETFGYSLMDVGVGLFVYSNGIVAPETSRVHGKSLTKTLKDSLPLFVLGAVRFFLVRETDYHVPTSEYGVHWNFFITLAVTKIFSSLILNTINVKYIYINAILLLFTHEVLLESGLKNFVFGNAKRVNFVVANREGLVSSLGYVSLYLLSVYIGYNLRLKRCIYNKSTITKFAVVSLGLFLMSSYLQNNYGISRRLANSAYCFWILFIGVFMTGLYYVSEIIQSYVSNGRMLESPLIFNAINYNGLVFFLLSNILTGLVNISCDTLKIGSNLSLVIILGYMFVNCLVVYILYLKRIKLKL